MEGPAEADAEDVAGEELAEACCVEVKRGRETEVVKEGKEGERQLLKTKRGKRGEPTHQASPH